MIHISKALQFFNGNPRMTETMFRNFLENLPELNTTSVNFDLQHVKIVPSNYSHENCTANYDNEKDVYTIRIENVSMKQIKGVGVVHYAHVPLVGDVSRSGNFSIDSLNMRIVISMKINRRYDISDVTVRFEEVPVFRVKLTNTRLGRLIERFLARMVERNKVYILNQVARSIERCLCDAGPYLRQTLK